jgi:hypothetical protein
VAASLSLLEDLVSSAEYSLVVKVAHSFGRFSWFYARISLNWFGTWRYGERESLLVINVVAGRN